MWEMLANDRDWVCGLAVTVYMHATRWLRAQVPARMVVPSEAYKDLVPRN